MPECFTVFADEIENRIDPHFYRPEYTKLDKKVKWISNKKLGDYIISISGGATPDIKEPEKYYSDETEGIAFLRVQNITPEGLNLEDVKFINKTTHKGMLKRSQVQEFSLLIKITGVGRMAVSSVAPKGFVGNINQHLVVIKTENENTSKILSVFLNSDIGEKLATKRATGGTRPALDYEALKSIPVVFKPEIVNIYENAIIRKKKIEIESQKLLDSLNDYILDELGIKMPEFEKKMCFTVSYDDVKIGRIDPSNFLHPQDTPSSKKFKEKSLSEVSSLVKGKSITKENITSGDYSVIAGGQSSPYSINIYNHKGNVITVSASGAYSGYVWYHDKSIFASDCTVIKSLDEDNVSTFYLYCVMKAKQKFIYNMQQGAGQPHVYSRDLSNLKIPLPPLSIQTKIAEEVKARMQKADQLQKEAKEELEKAKLEVEKIILGDGDN